MTGNESITLLFIISVVSIACTIYSTFAGRRKDLEKKAEEYAEIRAKLDGIATDQRSALVKIEKTAGDVSEIREQVLRHGFVLEDHEKRITELERRKDI